MNQSSSTSSNKTKAAGKTRRCQAISKVQFVSRLLFELPAETLLPEETFALIFGRLETARRVAKSARLRHLMGQLGLHSVPPLESQPENLSAPPRPIPVLSFLNRSPVFPPLVRPEEKLEIVNLSEILGIIRNRHELGKSWHYLLELLVTSSGLTWEAAAILLRKITGHPIDDIDVAATRQARLFWDFYAEGRARFAALMLVKELTPWRGDWAYFSRVQLQALLAGVILPDHCQRREYFTNYLNLQDHACLDLYSASALPLVQHPFFPEFNPLIFGKPRQLQLGN